MAKKFSDLEAKMSPASRARSDILFDKHLAEMPLHELRQARGLSQKMLAEVLHVQQPSIAKIEKRTDMYLSTLRSHIEAMGGELAVAVRTGAGTVIMLDSLSSLAKPSAPPTSRSTTPKSRCNPGSTPSPRN